MPRKRQDIWILTAVTYGIVCVLTLGAAIYYYAWSTRSAHGAIGADDKGVLVAVGSVWVPAYPGAVIASRSSSEDSGVTKTALELKSPDPAARLFSFYQRRMKSGSFLLSPVTRNGEGGTIQATVRDGKGRVIVTIDATPDGSTVNITSLVREPSK